jgi:hypothetical protein
MYKKYKSNRGFTFCLFSLSIGILFTLLMFSLLITNLVYTIPQAIAYIDTTINLLSISNKSLHDTNQTHTLPNTTRIYFERSGGFAGISISTTVDTQSLPPDEAHRLQGMIDNAKEFFDLKTPLQSSLPKRATDFFKYKITIETEEKQKTVETNDTNMPSELRPLISYLTEKIKKKQE